jgi:hypothetical protein
MIIINRTLSENLVAMVTQFEGNMKLQNWTREV